MAVLNWGAIFRRRDSGPVTTLVLEFERRVKAGERLSRSEFIAEHPEMAAELARALESVQLTGEGPLAPSMPGPQEVVESPPLPVLPGYEVQAELGAGAMGRVYRAYDTVNRRAVAIKTLYAGPLATIERVKRLRHEALASSQLQHPNVVQVYDTLDLDGTPFVVMELVEGSKSLKDLCTAQPMPPARALDLVRQIALALDLAHRNGIVHRDVKPTNVLMAGDVPKLSDFGLAHLEGTEVSRLTKSGELLGTICYMPPEQATGHARPDPRWDLYALGATLYECLTGAPPFDGTTPVEVLAKIQRDDVQPPAAAGVNLHADIEAICVKCLEKDPAKRYQTGAELAADIQRYLDGVPVAAPRVHWRVRRARRFLHSRRGAALACLATVVFIGLAAWQADRIYYRARLGTLLEWLGAPPPGGSDYSLALLRRAARADEPETRLCVVRALVRRLPDPAAGDLLRTFVDDPEADVCAELAQILQSRRGAVTTELAGRLLRDPRQKVQVAAIRLASSLGDLRFVPELQDLTLGGDRVVRQFAFSALLNLAPPALSDIAGRLLREGKPDSRLDVLRALGKGQIPPPFPAIIALLADVDTPPEQRQLAGEVLQFCTGETFGADPAAAADWSAWWTAHRAEWRWRRVRVVNWAKPGETLMTGDVLWTLDEAPLPPHGPWAPQIPARVAVVRQGTLVPLTGALGRHSSVDLYINLVAGRPVGTHPVVPRLAAVLAAATTPPP